MTSRAQTTTVFGVAGVLLATAAVWGLVMVRTDARHHGIGDPQDYGPLTAAQYAAAVKIADAELARDHGRLTSATAILTHGRVRQPNLHATCTSGRIIKIRLIGHFPNIVVGGAPGEPSGPDQAVVYVADAATGRACLLGVSLGHLSAYRHSADLMPALAHR